MYINGLNDYAYTLNNPVIYSDPSGEVIPIVIVGAVLVGANIGAFSTWYDNGTFSPLNSSFGEAAYGAAKGGIISGATMWNPFVGSAISGGFSGYETLNNNETCSNWGDAALNAVKDGLLNLLGYGISGYGAVGLSKIFPKQMLGDSSKRLFWSGFGKGGADIAKDFAKQNGLITLEMTNLGRLLENHYQYNFLTKGIWKNASGAFANSAAGTAYSYLGKVGEKSIWNTVEMPILKNNGVKIISVPTFLKP